MGLWTILIKRFFLSSLSLARPYSIIHYSVSSSLFWTVIRVIIPLYNTIRVDYEHYSTNANIALWIKAISIFTFGLILRNFREFSLLHPIVFETCGSRRDSEHLLIQSYLHSTVQFSVLNFLFFHNRSKYSLCYEKKLDPRGSILQQFSDIPHTAFKKLHGVPISASDD